MPDLHPEVELPISLLRMSQYVRVFLQLDRPARQKTV